jgi:hypothetical protein
MHKVDKLLNFVGVIFYLLNVLFHEGHVLLRAIKVAPRLLDLDRIWHHVAWHLVHDLFCLEPEPAVAFPDWWCGRDGDELSLLFRAQRVIVVVVVALFFGRGKEVELRGVVGFWIRKRRSGLVPSSFLHA